MSENTSLKNLTAKDYRNAPQAQNEFLQSLGTPHVDSFNYLLDEGLDQAVSHLEPVEFLKEGKLITLSIGEIRLYPPSVPSSTAGVRKPEILPTECRQRASSYSGRLVINLNWKVDGVDQIPIEREIGNIPVMLKSKICYLSGKSPSGLIAMNEHPDEWGGYFVVKGNEKLIRMLLITRRNFPIAVKRTTWKKRGQLFSDMGLILRCVKNDQTSTSNVLHYVTDGSLKLMFSYRKSLFYAPIMLIIKCIVNIPDEAIFKKLMAGHEDDSYMRSNIMSMLRNLHLENIHTYDDARKYFGQIFRVKMNHLSPSSTSEDVTDFFLRNCILIHLDDYEDKWNCLVFMVQKLYSFAVGKCLAEGVDGVMTQELLLGGHLYLQVIKERVQMWLYVLKLNILKKLSSSLSHSEMSVLTKKCGTIDLAVENFLATGNIKSSSGLGLMQDKGLVIIAENINRMRYMSHFRAVHRGAFFKDMRTTEARQLLPDAWGFICPVHTPDGAPCGLLNHLTKECQVSKTVDHKLLSKLPEILMSLGMISLATGGVPVKDCYIVVLDGKFIGYVPKLISSRFADKLRFMKIIGEKVPSTLEIAFVPSNRSVGQYPGLFLFTGPARMMRPVLNLAAKKVELIGTFEQVYLDICVTPNEAHPGITTHQELSKTNFMSNLACLIPMPDCNQSPRNMYQCQMGKQTMGTPCHNWQNQSETKLYRLQTPATPLFRPAHYDKVKLDDFPMGTNAIVAVISHTGYDMEDAMIINKSSLERGFAHGSIWKTEFVELKSSGSYFGLDPDIPDLKNTLGDDGLPFPGAKLIGFQPYYCYFDHDTSKYIVGKYPGKEEGIVDHVKMCGTIDHKEKIKACIVYRVPRNPSVGDKFASRAGQKGICSQQWPTEDLPFTDSGLVPDIVFNPHGFPSRMTIAMIIECLAGKSAAVHGLVHDATPFGFTEEDTALHYFGKLLRDGGYNYYGTERMYSGITGCEMTADIFFGVVHYQRLRHMVSDKWQVRSTGPIDSLTRQPVKGRRHGGGVRFGEMERDSLISHGASFLLQDRLFHCSDKSSALICRSCDTILGPIIKINSSKDDPVKNLVTNCQVCGGKANVALIEIPYVLKFLVSQLACFNVQFQLNCDV